MFFELTGLKSTLNRCEDKDLEILILFNQLDRSLEEAAENLGASAWRKFFRVTLPLVLASGAGAASRHSIGTGIIGGMIGATSLALFFVPLFYYLITSLRERLSGGRPAQAGER